ncbi:hypothetical protein D9M68_612990 [compost metagenome]
MRPQFAGQRFAALVAQGVQAFGRQPDQGGKARRARDPAQAGFRDVRVPRQRLLEHRQRDALLFDLDDAVQAAEQPESASGEFRAIRGLFFGGVDPGGLHAQRAFGAQADGDARQRTPILGALAPSDGARLGTAVDLRGAQAQVPLDMVGYLGGQFTARGVDADQPAAQRRPVQPFSQAPQQRGASYPGKGGMAQAGLLQIFRVDALDAVEHASRGKRPQHPEGQAVHMLRRYAAQHGRARVGPLLLQRADFVHQLPPGLGNVLGLAAGTGGAQHQLLRGIQFGGRQRRMALEVRQPPLPLHRHGEVGIGQPGIHRGVKHGAGMCLGIAGEHRGHARAPAGKKRDRHLGGIFEPERDPTQRFGLQGASRQEAGMREGAARQERLVGDGNVGVTGRGR